MFSAQYPKRYCKSYHSGPFEAKYPKRYQNSVFFLFFLIPDKYDKHHRHCYMGLLPPGLQAVKNIVIGLLALESQNLFL